MVVGNRRRIPKAVKEQLIIQCKYLPPQVVARSNQVGLSTVYRLRSLYRREGVAQRRSLPTGRPRTLNAIDIGYLESCIQRTPDIYLEELQDALHTERDILVSKSTICRALRARGITRKRVSSPAVERDEERRAAFQIRIAENYTLEQLVFVDEAGVNRKSTKRGWGWAPIGWRAWRRDFFVRGKRFSVLPALSLDGVLHLDVIPRSWTAALFNDFIDGLLDNMNPFPGRNSVIVMDNASIHKSPELRPMIEARGMRLEYLPPYSPDFDPIEEGFSAMKAWIRANRDYARAELEGEGDCDPYQMLWHAVFQSMTPEKALGWYRDSGYTGQR